MIKTSTQTRETKQCLGTIITGSLAEGLIMRIDPSITLDGFRTGKFVSIVDAGHTFFSLVIDIRLEVSHPDILLFPPTNQEILLKKTLGTKNIYATALLKPMMALDARRKMLPVKTVPTHFSSVFDADEQDVKDIFGDENNDNRRYFCIGSLIDMNSRVCIDLEKITERSNGIFGKTGTGKTFLTRLVLAGLISNNKAACIIFDMHNEYGLQARREGNDGSFVKGLKTLFPHRIATCSLGSLHHAGKKSDLYITLTYQSITVEDILSLQDELNLHPTAYEAAYLISSRYQNNWLAVLLAKGQHLKELAHEVGAHPESIAALYRKLKHIDQFPFLRKTSIENTEQEATTEDTIQRMMEYIDQGISLIIEFGDYTSSFCYLLIANIITRRIHSLYIRKTERFLASHKIEHEPKKLMIVIEEAHKFLNSIAARQTIFGTIAREMRKYYVSLLVIDQRPSGIDPEILSQIGTKIIAQLHDDRDIQAVLAGTNQTLNLRPILSSLESKKQVLLTGHAVPMPIVIETRTYDESFYRDIVTVASKSIGDLVTELF